MSVRSLRYNTIEQHFTKSALASTDRDALAFLEAAQIYNTNQQRAIVNLVRSLKRVGLWSKMKAIYPFVGGTASSHKWNLKDPRDVDAAFRLSFQGGWTHSSTGADPNGTTAYADTFLIPNTDLINNDHHFSCYVREDTAGSSIKCEIGSIQSGGSFVYQVIYSKFNNLTYNVSGTNIYPNYSNIDSRGYYIVAKSTLTTLDGYKNNVKKLTDATTWNSSGYLSTKKMFIGAASLDDAPAYYSDRQIAFATIGSDITDSEATALYNIVDLYQKRLGRAV